MQSTAFASKCAAYAIEIATKMKPQQQRKTVKRLTQKELLTESIRTEFDNTQSLYRLEQLAEERKVVDVTPKIPYSGTMLRYHSKLGAPKTITVIQGEGVEEKRIDDHFFSPGATTKRNHPPHHRGHPGNHHHHHS